MNINTKIILAVAMLATLLIVSFLIWQNTTPSVTITGTGCTQEAKLCSDGSQVSRQEPTCQFSACPKEDLIMVESPIANQSYGTPITITGKARGYWYFEANFPIKLYDENNTLLAEGYATTESEWMTENFVPFSATINFTIAKDQKGILVLEKSNPSDLPENADELRIPLLLKK